MDSIRARWHTSIRARWRTSIRARWRTSIDALAAPVATRGQGLAEYALILALVAIVAIVALIFLGSQISDILSDVGTNL